MGDFKICDLQHPKSSLNILSRAQCRINILNKKNEKSSTLFLPVSPLRFRSELQV
jgi:hypothetical protein